METKICKKCETKKVLGDFRDNRSECKKCENKGRKIREMKRRAEDPEYDKKCKEYDVKRKRKKESECPLEKGKQDLRVMIRRSLSRNGYTKKSKTFDIIGMDYPEFRTYIEGLFVEGMNWGNKGKWVYDHKVPLCLAIDKIETEKLCHYSNLQPLWSEDNNKKGDKLLPEFEDLKFKLLGR